MAQQWVDFSTLNNTTPFSKVRWKSRLSFNSGYDSILFSEVSGLTVDGMLWFAAAGAGYGYASTHRCFENDNTFTCTFLNDYRTANDVIVDSWNSTAGTAVHDVSRSNPDFYDDVVTISGETFYEVDFSTWSGYTELYSPYSAECLSAGQVYVFTAMPAIVIDKVRTTFKSSGGTNNITVTADNDWTATVSSGGTGWVTLSDSSGTSGTSVITVSAPDYSAGTSARTAIVTFTCDGVNAELTVKQKAPAIGDIGNVYIGSVPATDMYVGGQKVDAMYIGDQLVFPLS